MKALLYRLDGKVTEFELRDSPPYFILVDHKDDKTTETLFRRLVDHGPKSVGHYAENGATPELFQVKAQLARYQHRIDYATEMEYMAKTVAEPSFTVPVVGKIEKYSSWVPGMKLIEPIKQPYEFVQINGTVANSKPWLGTTAPWSAQDVPFQIKYKGDQYVDYGVDYGDPYPIGNPTVTTPPVAAPPKPPSEPDVIGEPKKRLIMIPKEE